MRAKRLLAEARSAANEQVTALEEVLAQVAEIAAEIADGGDLYPVGARDLCRKLSADAVWNAQTLGAILHHVAPADRK
jgi:hypothetical protein